MIPAVETSAVMSTIPAPDIESKKVVIESSGSTENAATPAEWPEADTSLTPAPLPLPKAERLVSLDAYRGLVMVLMISAGLQISRVVASFDQNPDLRHLKTPLWERLAYQTSHAPWVGCSLWDLIQPAFMFMVGAALPFSIASRRAKGQMFGRMLVHAIIRAAVLVLLGVFLMSGGKPRTNWTFDNVLTQIGLGYVFLFLLAWVKPRWQLAAAGMILVGYWAAFALYPSADLDPARFNMPADWHRLEGFAAHWEKHVNLGARFDQWFLNLFPRPDGKRFDFYPEGYVTLNFIPSLATMIFGLLAGELVRNQSLRAGRRIAVMIGAGLVGLALGWVLNATGINPLVKRIWTPSWALFSAGWVVLFLAAFYALLDVARWRERVRPWALPLVVVGMNSIAAYCISMTLKSWVRENMRRHFGQGVYQLPFGEVYAPMVEAGFFLLFAWAVCWWMYRNRVFVRI